MWPLYLHIAQWKCISWCLKTEDETRTWLGASLIRLRTCSMMSSMQGFRLAVCCGIRANRQKSHRNILARAGLPRSMADAAKPSCASHSPLLSHTATSSWRWAASMFRIQPSGSILFFNFVHVRSSGKCSCAVWFLEQLRKLLQLSATV